MVGGDKLYYHPDAGSPASNLTETKILINSVISDAHKGARFLSMDIKYFYLETPMLRPEYMKVPLKYFSQDIQDKYKLQDLVHSDGHVYTRINKGMHGLKQADVLAYK